MGLNDEFKMTNDEMSEAIVALGFVIRHLAVPAGVIRHFSHWGGDQRETFMPKYHRAPWLLLAFFLGAAQADADQALRAARGFYEAGQWHRAATAFDRVAEDGRQAKATRQTARLYAGEALMQLGAYDDALKRYQRVGPSELSDRLAAQTQFRLGEAAWLSGDAKAAAGLLEAYVEKYPHGPSIAYAKKHLVTIRTRQSAQQDFALLDEAVGWERDGRHDVALAAYDQILKQPLSGLLRAEALRRAAKLHARLAQSGESLSLYRVFLEEYPSSPRVAEVMLAVARLYDQLDQSTQAADQFRGVCLKFPQSAQAADAAYWLVRHFSDKKEVADAPGHVKQALRYADELLAREQLANDRPQLWGQTLCLKSQLLAAQGKWHQVDALVESERAQLSEGPLSVGPLRAKLDFWAAEAAFRLRQYDLARDRFADLQPLVAGINEPWVGMVPLRRAQLAARQQRWGEVLKILDQFQREMPEFELDYEVDYLRGRALAGRGEMTAARRFYAQVLTCEAAQGSEAAVMAQWMIGETYFHQRDYPRARAEYKTVMQQASLPEWRSRAALQAGKCWELENEWAKAEQVYLAALQDWPDSDSDNEIETRLRWAQRQSTELQQPTLRR